MCMVVIAANEFSDIKWTTRQSVCNGLILHLQRPHCWMDKVAAGEKREGEKKRKEKEERIQILQRLLTLAPVLRSKERHAGHPAVACGGVVSTISGRWKRRTILFFSNKKLIYKSSPSRHAAGGDVKADFIARRGTGGISFLVFVTWVIY